MEESILTEKLIRKITNRSQRKEKLGMYTIEKLGPRGSKSNVLEIKRN